MFVQIGCTCYVVPMKLSEVQVGLLVKVAGTRTNNGRGNAVGVVTEIHPNGIVHVEAGVEGSGLTILVTRASDVRAF